MQATLQDIEDSQKSLQAALGATGCDAGGDGGAPPMDDDTTAKPLVEAKAKKPASGDKVRYSSDLATSSGRQGGRWKGDGLKFYGDGSATASSSSMHFSEFF